MGILKSFLCMLGTFALTITLAHAQSSSDFISIDCGLAGPDYSDNVTGINYVSDASYIETGKNSMVSSRYEAGTNARHLLNLRYFPDGIRNCYTLRPPKARGSKFLIRATFFYGNYDFKQEIPEFDVHIGPNLWLSSLQAKNESTYIIHEVIHVPLVDYIQVCLVNTRSGTPFISALEIRRLKTTIYEAEPGLLWLVGGGRRDTGSLKEESKIDRYKNDIYDRLWKPYTPLAVWSSINTSLTVEQTDSNGYLVPSPVMQTAAQPGNASESLEYFINPDSDNSIVYAYLHFAEVKKLQINETREFNIFVDEIKFHGPIVPDYLSTKTVSFNHNSGQQFKLSLSKTERSTLPPAVNAIELYRLLGISHSETEKNDVAAIQIIKTFYKIKRNWQGDPCSPGTYVWSGLDCNYEDNESPKIISLNLSSSGLTGEIASYIANLTSLTILDLSNNNLSGMVPKYFSELQALRLLNLSGNNLTGPIPDDLVKRWQDGKLDLRVDGVTKSCSSTSCGKKKKNIVLPIIAAVGTLLAVSTALAVVLWFCKRRREAGKFDAIVVNSKSTMESKNRQLKHAEVVEITNNFERIIGKGGFGTVYYGVLGDIQVAVKVLSSTSIQGYQQFQAEVNILMRVHHKNLATLIGYCNEGTNLSLVYEYMENGDLQSHLSGESAQALSWEGRLRIAVDAAQGLEYMHHGCTPSIIHRDIKTTNILLDKSFQAKLADFGLSKLFQIETGSSHVSTVVAGTPGYLDPQYYESNRLNEKTDVYSFGVVILELISSRPVIMRNHEQTHIKDWFRLMIEKGDAKSIVDQRIQGDVDISSVWRAIEVAMSCVSSKSNERPSMNEVVNELKACLEMEISRKQNHGSGQREAFGSIYSISSQAQTMPLAR